MTEMTEHPESEKTSVREIVIVGVFIVIVLLIFSGFFTEAIRSNNAKIKYQYEYQHQIDSLIMETQQLEQEYFELHYKYSTCCEAVIDSSGR